MVASSGFPSKQALPQILLICWLPSAYQQICLCILPTRSVSLSALTQWGEWRWFDNELLSVAILYRSPSNCHVPSGHLGFISASGLSPCNPQQRQQEAKWLRNGSMLDLSISPLHHKESGILTNPCLVV